MAHILITGAAGFIGSHLSEALLAKGYKVTGIDNFDPFYHRSIKEANLSDALQHPDYTFIEADITRKTDLDSLDSSFQAIIHLAAKAGVRPSIEDPESYMETNFRGTQNILEWMVKRDIKNLVFASSSSVYGNNKKIPFSERDPVDHPISPYAYTKKACELMIHTFHHLYDISTLCLRFFTVYGPRQRPDLAIHKFLNLINEGKDITMYGDGSTSRDYTYVANTVSGIIQALNYTTGQPGPVYEVINLGNNQPVKLHDMIEQLIEAAGKQTNIIQTGMQPGDVDITYANIDKAVKLLGYNPEMDFRSGLEEFVKWYEQNQA